MANTNYNAPRCLLVKKALGMLVGMLFVTLLAAAQTQPTAQQETVTGN